MKPKDGSVASKWACCHKHKYEITRESTRETSQTGARPRGKTVNLPTKHEKISERFGRVSETSFQISRLVSESSFSRSAMKTDSL